MWPFASHQKSHLASAGAGTSNWGKVQGRCMPEHSFILPPFACGQQHMRFLFVPFLKMSPNGNRSGLKGLQVWGIWGLCLDWSLEMLNAENTWNCSALLKRLHLIFQV